jgi:hypothetical protein
MTSPPAPERVAQRLKEQFAPAYLTLTSIIQGVALTALVVRVEALYPQFGAVDWVLAVARVPDDRARLRVDTDPA